MNSIRKHRLLITIFIVLTSMIAVGLALYALRQNVNLFYTPSQVKQGEIPLKRHFRIGGMVEKGSVRHSADGLKVEFTLTDTANTIKVRYHGILPDLFREGQGIVAEGKLNKKGYFVADEVLAKHDEKYMPPITKHTLQEVVEQKQHDTRIR